MEDHALTATQQRVIRSWARMIRETDEEQAVRLLTTIVVHVARDPAAIDRATQDVPVEPKN
jgi:hypothetical protein